MGFLRFWVLLGAGVTVAAAVSPTHAASMEALKQRLAAATEPLVRERLQLAIAEQSTDALEAFDHWLALAKTAELPERRSLAVRRAAILGLMLGQQGPLERLEFTPETPEERLLQGLIAAGGDGRAPQPELHKGLVDRPSDLVLEQWWRGELNCRKDARHDPLLCPVASP